MLPAGGDGEAAAATHPDLGSMQPEQGNAEWADAGRSYQEQAYSWRENGL